MPQEQVDPLTGEITIAADGGRVPPAAPTFSATIALLNDGQFDADVSHDMRELIRKMVDHSRDGRKVVKGQLVVTLDINLSNGAHVIRPSIKVKSPVTEQPGTLMFSLADGRLSRFPPDQGQFFGVREVGAAATPVRDI